MLLDNAPLLFGEEPAEEAPKKSGFAGLLFPLDPPDGREFRFEPVEVSVVFEARRRALGVAAASFEAARHAVVRAPASVSVVFEARRLMSKAAMRDEVEVAEALLLADVIDLDEYAALVEEIEEKLS